jgi:hypothetical protein
MRHANVRRHLVTNLHVAVPFKAHASVEFEIKSRLISFVRRHRFSPFPDDVAERDAKKG